MNVETVVQEAIEEWASIHSCQNPPLSPTLARYVTTKVEAALDPAVLDVLARLRAEDAHGESVGRKRFLVDAASFIDLSKGTNFPDEFVHDMAKCLRRGRDLLGGR